MSSLMVLFVWFVLLDDEVDFGSVSAVADKTNQAIKDLACDAIARQNSHVDGATTIIIDRLQHPSQCRNEFETAKHMQGLKTYRRMLAIIYHTDQLLLPTIVDEVHHLLTLKHSSHRCWWSKDGIRLVPGPEPLRTSS
jgi:hypothetical protein